MKVYIVWEIVHDFPENGGGEYLENIFLSYSKAETFVKKKQKDDNYISYKIRSFEIEKGE